MRLPHVDSRGPSGPSERQDAIRANRGVCPNALSLGGRLTWESKHECALEGRKYHPNVRQWSEPLKESPVPGRRFTVINKCEPSSVLKGVLSRFAWVILLAQVNK